MKRSFERLNQDPLPLFWSPETESASAVYNYYGPVRIVNITVSSGSFASPTMSRQAGIIVSDSSFGVLRRFIHEQDSEPVRLLALDLLDALKKYAEGDSQAANDIIEQWVETAEICFEPGALQEIREAEEEISEGGGVFWTPPTK